MPLWGSGRGATQLIAEKKPTFLTAAEQRAVYATTRGWTQAAQGNGNAAADREVLVAIGGLSGAEYLAEASISSINWVTTSMGHVAGGMLEAIVNYNEVVTVAGNVQLEVDNNGLGSGVPGVHTMDLASTSGTGTNRVHFEVELLGLGEDFAELDVITIGQDAVKLNGGSIVDTESGNNAAPGNSAALGTNAGSITVGP